MSKRMRLRLIVPACLAIGFAAMSPVSTAGAQGFGGGPSTEQLLQQLEERNAEFDTFDWPRKGRFTLSQEFIDAYAEFNKRLWREHGITYLYAPTIMMQAGTQGGPNDVTANFQHNILLAWRMFQDTQLGTGTFVFNALQIWQLANANGVAFSKALGINYLTSDSPTDSDTLKALYWRQDFPGNVFSIRFGHDELAGIVNSCTYACDDTQSFISQPLSANPASTLPGQGMSVIAGITMSDYLSFEFGLADGNGDGTLNAGRAFDTGELAYAGTVTLMNPLMTEGDGRYRFSYYYVDPTKQGTSAAMASTSGIAINIDQDFGDVGLFGKYATSFGRSGLAKHYAAAGAVWNNPFGYNEDRLGLGFGWVDPSAAGTNSEYVAETYYRMQVTPLVTMTVDGMAIINPSSNPNNVEGVFSLRGRAHF